MAHGWLADSSDAEIRRGLALALPGLVIEKLSVRPRHASSNPMWWASSAFVNGALVAKFAWSEVRALLLHREGVLLQRLAALAPDLPLPDVVALYHDPVLVITRLLDGEPLSWGAGSDLRGDRLADVAEVLAGFLARLHRLPVDDVLGGLPQVTPKAQSDTGLLLARYVRLVDDGRARLVHAWCEWVDQVLDDVAPVDVVVHGDLHGYNQLWNFDARALVAVMDFEQCGPGDRHFDFRYLPGNSSSTELLSAVVAAYERHSGAALSLERIMAWHILTVLGDALWRTEAGVDLPGGGDAGSYVDDIQQRLDEIHIKAAT